MKTIRRRDVTAVLAILPLALAGCEERKPGGGVGAGASAAPSAAPAAKSKDGISDTEIKIGSFGPLSGPAAAWGVVLHSLNAYFAHINEKGGVHGRKIKFVYLDDQYNPSKTPGVVRELVEKEDVFAIVAGIGTANGRSVADYLESKGVPFFTPASGDKFWSEGGKKNVYTAFPKYATEGEILGAYAGRDLKKKTAAVLYQDDDFGKQGLEGFKAGFEKNGGKVAVEVSTQPTDTDLAGQASKIAEGKPDVLVLYCGIKQGVTAVKMLDAQKKKPDVLSSFVLGDPMLLKLGGEAWNGTISSTVGKLPDSDDPSVKMYRDVIEKYGGGKLPVGGFTMAGVLFGMPFTEALQRAGKDLTRDKFYKALHELEDWPGPGPYWEGDGLGPRITFSEDQRLGFNTIRLIKVDGGKWVDHTGWMGVSGPVGGADAKGDGGKGDKDDKDDDELMKELLEE